MRPTISARPGRTVAAILVVVTAIQVAGPTIAALHAAPRNHADGGAHHPGCPFEGRGDCPHATHDGHPRLTQCGDDEAVPLTDAQPRSAPATIEALALPPDPDTAAPAVQRPPLIRQRAPTAIDPPPPRLDA